jgi:DegV family protein with EDD domain
MSREIAIVTDSTACLPEELAAERGVDVVPLQVVIGTTSYSEGPEATSRLVAQALRGRVAMSTSRPPPAAFLEAFQRASAGGCLGVVSLHLSAEMSGTYESALLAAREAPIPVRVVDSRSLGMGLGYAVLTAADAADAGAPVDAVAAAAEKRAAAADVIFYVDTLEYLRRGGRIGAAAALVGSALGMKPLLHLVDGHVAPLEKVRTATRAITRLEELVLERAGDAEVDVAVHHLASALRAQALADRLRFHLPNVRDLHLSEVGAVVGAHVGPGLLAVVVAPR